MHRILGSNRPGFLETLRADDDHAFAAPLLLVVGPERACPEHDPALFERDLEFQMLVQYLHHRSEPVRGPCEYRVELFPQHPLTGVSYVLCHYFWL